MAEKELVEQLRVVDSELADIALLILEESNSDLSLRPFFQEVIEFIGEKSVRDGMRFDLIERVTARVKDKKLIKKLAGGQKSQTAPEGGASVIAESTQVSSQVATPAPDEQVQIQDTLNQLQQLQQTVPTSAPLMNNPTTQVSPIAEPAPEVPAQPFVEAPVAPAALAEDISVPEMPPLPVAEPAAPAVGTPVAPIEPAVPVADEPATTPQ